MSSSSIKDNNKLNYGPEFAIDNCYSDVAANKSFVSKEEDHPWLQWKFAGRRKKKLTHVTIGIPRHCCGYYKMNVHCSYTCLCSDTCPLETYEVRAGRYKLDGSFRGPIDKNKVCEMKSLDNPFIVKGEYAKYVFSCQLESKYIKASYITVQIKGRATLAISEIDVKFIQRQYKPNPGKLY